MPVDPKKREKAVMKRRRQQKAAARKQVLSSPLAQVRRAREFPILECRISKDWERDDSGLVRVVVARQMPNGTLIVGAYLVDVFCLGLKNALYDAPLAAGEYRRHFLPELERGGGSLAPCPPELAHQIIYQAIDYAAQFGFEPHKDFGMAQLILERRGTLPEPYTLTFGREGKPFFIQGPYDDVRKILARLEKHAGPGNYDYLLALTKPGPLE